MPTATKRAGHPHTDATRRVLSLRQFQHQATLALIDGRGSPLRRERIRRGLTVEAASRLALVSCASWQRAEADFHSVSAITRARISVSFRLPAAELLD